MRKKPVLILLVFIAVAAVASVPQTQAATPVVTVGNKYNVTEPGRTFQINITITDVTFLSMWIVNLTWDPNIIKITTGDPQGLRKGKIYYNIYEGPFMKDATFIANEIDNTRGKITRLGSAYQALGSTASGSGVLATINFTSINVGTTTININGPSKKHPGHSVLQDQAGEEMPHEDVDGMATEHAQPLIWMEPWFQATTVGIIVVIVGVTYVIIKKRPEKGAPLVNVK